MNRMQWILLAGALCVLAAALAGGCTDSRVQPLIDDLSSDDPATRRAAAEELAAIGTPAVEPLVEVFSSGDADASIWAAVALCEIGEPAVDPLIGVLGASSEDERMWAATTLACIGRPAIAPLITEVETGMGVSRESAKVALIQMGSVAVPSIQQRMAVVDAEKKETYRKLILSIQVTEQMRAENASGSTGG